MKEGYEITLRPLPWILLLSFLTTPSWSELTPGQAVTAFERLKSLQGDWTGQSERGGKSHLTYAVVSRGSAVVETYRDEDPPPGDRMITVYYLDRNRLMLTHYCIAKNQPRMVADQFDPVSGRINFEFLDAANLETGAGHMHRIRLQILDHDHLVSEADHFNHAQLSFSEATTYVRTTTAPSSAPAEQNRTPPKTSASDGKEQILAVMDRLTNAGLRRDTVTLKTLYSPDYFHTNPDGSVMDLNEVLESYAAPPKYQFDSAHVEERRFSLRDKTAIVNQILSLHGRKDNVAFVSRYRVTYVLTKDDGDWKVVNSHSSLLEVQTQ